MPLRKDPLDAFVAVLVPVLAAAPARYLSDLRAGLRRRGIQRAVRQHDTAALFDWITMLAAEQGISNRNALGFIDRNGNVGFDDIAADLSASPACARLRSYWSFSECGYRKAAQTCAEPTLLPSCPLPRHELRKGALNQAAFSLWLFVRDVCDGDFVRWTDSRLAAADPGRGVPGRSKAMREAVLEPLNNVHGIGDKLWSMILAELLLGGDPGRERWVATGASMVAVDSLVHAFLVRTGTLRGAGAEHAYGPGCYGPRGCAELIEQVSTRIDARAYHPENPATFPRIVQFAIWNLCSEAGLDICNGRRIDDRRRCEQRSCPAFKRCERLPRHGRG